MSDLNLETKLRSVRVPERTDEYWDDFPSRVRMQLPRPIREERVCWRRRSREGWNHGLALGCALLLFSLVPVFQSAFKDDRLLRRETERFSRGMRVLMADQHGVQDQVIDSQ
jgi:hypothetical protein